jgi:L-ascorbate metabolism protein UlaG (beta-lactamase superfamily)
MAPRTTRLPLPGSVTTSDLARGSVLFVGTATTVIQYGGFSLLTDPNFLHAGDQAHLGYGLTSRRLTDPATEPEELPPLDACILSHLHGHHWDRVAEAKLSRALPILTTPHAARKLRGRGFGEARGLERWDVVALEKGRAWLRVTAMPGKHASGLAGAIHPPVMGSMLEFGVGETSALRTYISGDTLFHEELAEIPRRYPDVDLGLFHLGGTRVLGLLVTMDARQGVAAIRLVRPRVAIPIHYDDYPVFKSPLSEFRSAVAGADLDSEVRYLARGDRHEFQVFPHAEAAEDAGAAPSAPA